VADLMLEKIDRLTRDDLRKRFVVAIDLLLSDQDAVMPDAEPVSKAAGVFPPGTFELYKDYLRCLVELQKSRDAIRKTLFIREIYAPGD